MIETRSSEKEPEKISIILCCSNAGTWQVAELPPRHPGSLGRALASAGAKSATNLSGMLQRTTAAVKARRPILQAHLCLALKLK